MFNQNNKSKPEKTAIPPIDYDATWKTLLELHLQKALEFFMPKIAQKINFSKGFTFLEDELISLNIKKSTARVDKLIQFELKNNKRLVLLLHIEIQANNPYIIPKRMYEYALKIINKYPDAEFVSFILYIGNEHAKKINYYKPFTLSKSFIYQGEYYILAEHNEDELLQDGSAIALLLYLTKRINKNKKLPESRLSILKEFYELLEKKGMDEKIFKELISFAKTLVTLPPIFKTEYDNFLTQKYKNMANYYVSAELAEKLTNVEIDVLPPKGKTFLQLIKEGELKGIQKGKLEGKLEGEQIGIQKGKLEGIIKALKLKLLSIDQISQLFEVPFDFVLNIKNTHHL